MVLFIKANGKMTKQMAMEYTHMQMEQNMRVSGLMINNMVKVKKYGLIVLHIMDNIY